MSDIVIDNTISYAIDKSLEKITEALADISVDLFKSFKNNGMKANVGKFHLIVISKDKVFAKIRLYVIP